MSPQSILADRDFTRLKQRLLEATGLAYYAQRDEDLAQRLSRRAADCNVETCSAYLALLDSRTAGAQELEALIAELTIGETYFFRQNAQFRALSHTVFSDLIRRNERTRTLRIWSAGCATGAEPYSVAVLLTDEFGARLDGWRVSIVGTDINRAFLDRAREGKYVEWAFRECPAEIKSRCFKHEGREWVIRPEYRKWTSFTYHNLARDPAPSASHGIYSFDLILCRNVMIYFAPAMVRATVERLHDSLVPGGWLLVGHAEPNAEVFKDFRTVSFADSTLYQKPIDGEPATPIAPVLPPVLAVVEAPAPLPPALETSKPAAGGLDRVRALADLGFMSDALEACQSLLEHDRLNPQAHFLLALVLDQAGRAEESESALRRAVYLDRMFILAHYHLGLALQRKQQVEQARRSFINVTRLLGGRPDGDPIEGGDGMTAGDLRLLATMHLETLSR